MKALGSFVEGEAGYQAGKYNRRVMRVNEDNALRDGARQAADIRDKGRIAIGAQIAAQAASGFGIGTGSALDALTQSATERELDIMTARRNAKMQSLGFKAQGDLAYMQGRAALSSGIISGAAQIADSVAGMGGGGGGAGGGAGGAG